MLKAREHGVAAALILPGAELANDDINEVRIAFDGDAVLFDAASQQVYDAQGLDAFHEHEASHADEPMSPGPFRPFLDGLARIQAHFGATSPIRTALVTARAAPAHYRVVNTLRSWGVNVDETYFLGGVDKTAVLKAVRGTHLLRRPARPRRVAPRPRCRPRRCCGRRIDLPAARSPVEAGGRARSRQGQPKAKPKQDAAG